MANLAQVFAPLADFGRIFTPPPLDLDAYDGAEYRWKLFVFRPGLLRQEAILLGALVFYLLWFYLGSRRNHAKAKAWLDAHRSLYDAQFARPLDGGLIRDGHSDLFTFSSGRRAVASLHTIFALLPRHDVVHSLFQTLWQVFYDLAYQPRDELLLDFKLADSDGPGFVFAVVAKDELRSIKDGRWDLTFTKSSDNPALPSSLSVMSEFADVSESVFKHASAVLDALKDPAVQPYFRSLSITDQPSTHPARLPLPRDRHVLLSLTLPPPTKAHTTLPLVRATFTLVDALDRVGAALRPDTKSKLRKVREDLVQRIRDEEGREAREEAADARAEAKRKAEEERVAGLSAAEQAKILERERKRSQRKTQGKVVRK